jgi:hypothetical protein
LFFEKWVSHGILGHVCSKNEKPKWERKYPDYPKFENDQKWDGLKGYITNKTSQGKR